MNPSTCFSVSLICAAAICAGELVGKPTKTMIAATIMWYMAQPSALRIRVAPHPGNQGKIEHMTATEFGLMCCGQATAQIYASRHLHSFFGSIASSHKARSVGDWCG